MNKENLQKSLDIILEEINKIEFCPDFETCSIAKLERAERKEIELRNSLVIIADLIGCEVPFNYHNLNK